MNSLPSSIEKYLTEEAGFSSTEVLALRHLLHGEPMTLRELATKTGKSTGVLDQAMKKLLTRKILRREMVNDTPKFALASPEDIRLWMKKDIQEKQKILRRKEQDFESFVRSIEQDIARPQIEYFEGEEGLKKAYGKLLDLSDKELFLYLPMLCKEEEDPLGECRAQFARERKRRKIFLRVVGHECPLGKRYQSRDQFEFRKTVLVPQSACPLSFEKAIAGDSIACFNHEQKRACFIHYPELAEAEREMFEVTLLRCGEKKESTENIRAGNSISGLFELLTHRAFRKFIIISFVFAVLFSGITTYVIGRRNYDINLQRVRDRAMAIAANSVPEFDASDLRELKEWKDVKKPVYSKVLNQLERIRERNAGVAYVYIMKPTEDPYFLTVIADVDSRDIYDFPDGNLDGLRNDVLPPGYNYFDPTGTAGALYKTARFLGVFADELPYSDFWGVFIAGHAPILNKDGSLAGIFGVDIAAGEVQRLSKQSFRPWIAFTVMLGFFFVFQILFLSLSFRRKSCLRHS